MELNLLHSTPQTKLIQPRLGLNWVNFLTDFLALALGLSALSLWLLFLTGSCFNQFRYAALGSSLLALLIAGLRSRNNSVPTEGLDIRPSKPSLWGWLLIAAAAASPLIRNDSLFWLALLVISILLLSEMQRLKNWVGVEQQKPASAPTLGVLLLLAIIAAVVTLVFHRPDADDQFYVGMAMRLLDNPAVPMSELREFKSAYALMSYPALIAAAADLSGEPFLRVYFLSAPAVVAFLSVFVAYRLFSELSETHLLLTTAVFVVVLLCWGDMHRSPGNFAYVRLFQGKAVFCLVVMPLMLIYAIRVFNKDDPLARVMLAVTFSAGIGCTQTAIILGPLFLIICGGFLFPRALQLASNPAGARTAAWLSNFAQVFLTFLPLALPFILSLTIILMVGETPKSSSEHGSAKAVAYTLGTGWRALIGFGSLFLLPYTVKPSLRLPVCILVIGSVLVLNPVFADLLTWFGRSADWRIIWIIPFVPATALAISRLAQAEIWQRSPLKQLIVGALALVAFAALGRSTLSPYNNATLAWPSFKTENAREMMLRKFGKRPYPITDERLCLEETRCY